MSSFLRKTLNFYVFGFFILIFYSLSFGQIRDKKNISVTKENKEDESNIPAIGPTNCESLRAYLETYVINGEKPEAESKLIVIFRLNRKENIRYYNLRKKVIIDWLERYYPKQVVFAKSDSIDDLGRAEIYVNGKKSFIVKFKLSDSKVCFGGNAG